MLLDTTFRKDPIEDIRDSLDVDPRASCNNFTTAYEALGII